MARGFLAIGFASSCPLAPSDQRRRAGSLPSPLAALSSPWGDRKHPYEHTDGGVECLAKPTSGHGARNAVFHF